jgi:hypothetical protein
MRSEFALYRDLRDATELPTLQGKHTDYELGIDFDGTTCTTCLPNFAEIIDQKNNWSDELPATLLRNQQFQQAAQLLGAIALWISQAPNVHAAGLRAIAMAWTLRPRSFDCNSGSQLGRRYGTTKQSISKYQTELFHLAHGLFVSPQLRGHAYRRAAAESARRQHAQQRRERQTGQRRG